MKSIVHSLMRSLLSGHHCVLCRSNPTQGHASLCASCNGILPRLNKTCHRCARPLDASVKSSLCGQCLTSPPPYDRIITPFAYQAPIKTFIHALKFQKKLSYAPLLVELMDPTLQHAYREHNWPEALLPIPLHATRLRQRGFNQALEIALACAKIYNIPVLKHQAIRIKNTLPQAQTPAALRRKNLKDAFKIKPLPHRHIAIIDDVVTTGHTVCEYSRYLRRLGVEVIDVWCSARTII